MFGPLTLSIIIFSILFVVSAIVLQPLGARPARLRPRQQSRGGALFGRAHQAREALAVRRLRGQFRAGRAALCGAARRGPRRHGLGFELDIITMVLLGGVSIFGGSGNLVGVGLSILVILNLRNGMGLANITGNTQTSVIGALLILSVLVPNMAQWIHSKWRGREA